ncbi:MAG: LysM peptidoglycan-binding domain-containing protein [Verrucomicrobiales bacterium]|nr:LysM peptidoglycan-binding domain-containing protein [Verrucomicrobiales bacterium]
MDKPWSIARLIVVICMEAWIFAWVRAAAAQVSTEPRIAVRQGDTLSGLIEKHYRIKAFSGKDYDTLEKEILQLNGLKRPEDLRAGSGLIFHMPPTNGVQAPSREAKSTREGLYTVRVRTSGLYSETLESQARLSTLARLVAPTLIETKPKETISGILNRRFNVGTLHKKSARVIEREILRLNKIQKPELLKEGQCLIPSLPPRVRSGALTFTQQGHVSFSGIVEPDLEPGGAKIAFSTISAIESTTAPSESSQIDLTVNMTEALRYSLSSQAENVDVAAGPLPIKLAGATTPSSEYKAILSESERSAMLKALAARAKARRGTVYVHDTGWPSGDDYTNSLRHLWKVLDYVWVNGLRQTPPSRRPMSAFRDPTNPHCQWISAALQEFETLDPSNSVEVVYLPLINEQGADSLLIEMIQLSLLLGDSSTQAPLHKTTKALIKQRFEKAEAIVRALPKTWNGNLIDSDIAVVKAPFDLLDYYGRSNKIFFAINHSWTTPHNDLKLLFPAPMNGVLVAAAGNESPKYNAFDHRTRQSFVYRSYAYPDTIGVLNVKRDGHLDPTSSDLYADRMEDSMVVGLDGDVTGDVTGTSFSAPRFAWLLALTESRRRNEIDALVWCKCVRTLILKSRESPSKKFLLSMSDYLLNSEKDF